MTGGMCLKIQTASTPQILATGLRAGVAHPEPGYPFLMAKKNRRKAQPRKPKIAFVARPFEGLAAQAELTALYEILPCATMEATTVKGEKFLFVTRLPELWAALKRADGVLLVATQTGQRSGDASTDLAAALTLGLELEPGTPLASTGLPEPGPRLQELLDPEGFREIRIEDDFGFWLDPALERTEAQREELARTAQSIVPSAPVPGTANAFWCQMSHPFIRWIRTEPENRVLDALARLAASERMEIAPGARFVGAFRACGLLIPVWELPDGTEASALDLSAAATALESAITSEQPLDAQERRARSGIVSRQVTLR